MNNKKHILVADDDHDILAALKLLLTCEGYEVTITSHAEQAITLFKKHYFDCVLLDLNFQRDTTSGQEGLALIGALKALEPTIPLIVMTGWASIDIAVSAMQKGASDFIEKPWENERVISIIETQLKLAKQLHQSKKLNQENKLLKADSGLLVPLIAHSAAMKKVQFQAEQIAQSDIPVLITGENGTGKSLLAEFIHNVSGRNNHSMINVNMGAISENLFESEMFGHVKGAFTDAKDLRIGRFELADKGSLFLDEIGNIPQSQQRKLLRVLESQEFERVGDSKTQSSDVRIISATNANISQMIADGSFRQDLYYRLNSIEIKLPPLRERHDDIVPLAENFLAKFSAKYQKGDAMNFSSSAISALKQYQWPGNIRELSHMIERGVILSSESQISAELLAITLETASSSDVHINQGLINVAGVSEDQLLSLEAIEQKIIRQRIQHFQGNMQETAKSLGLSRSAFYRRIDKYQL